MDRLGKVMLTNLKTKVCEAMTGDNIRRDEFQSKDLLTLLVIANLASDVPESSRLTDDEVLARMSSLANPQQILTASQKSRLSWLPVTKQRPQQ